MKLIILEGCDKVGKSTIQNALVAWSESCIVRHWSFPKGNTLEEKLANQQADFNREFSFYQACKLSSLWQNDRDIMVWNRSHIGEMVYGQLYRGYMPHAWIRDLERRYAFEQDNDVLAVLLEAPVDATLARDDGESFSTDPTRRQREAELFREALDYSIIQNKLTIQTYADGSYRHTREILGEILRTLGNQ